SARAITSTMALPIPSTSKRRSDIAIPRTAAQRRVEAATIRANDRSQLLPLASPRLAVACGAPQSRGAAMAFKERVFSGVQPTGNLHLGNYLGAIVRFVALQERYDCIYCVVDLHALTMPISVWGGPQELARNTREVTAAYLAAGIDPKKH